MEYADVKWDHDEEAHRKFLQTLAPIVLFTYNRLDHTRRTIEALQKNIYAKDSRLFVYSDAPKNKQSEESVQSVRSYLHTVEGFMEVTIIERTENYGLARNIIDGVTSVVNEYGKIIVLEDDIITSKWFLKYMNDALELYKDASRVMEVNGFVLPVDDNDLPETFFLDMGDCWGWGTWARAWKFFERNPQKAKNHFTPKEVWRFNLDGTCEDRWQQVLMNCTGEIYTWAIFWDVAIFLQKGVSLFPHRALVRNIGMDGSGEHCTSEDFEQVMTMKQFSKFPSKIQVEEKAKKRYREYYLMAKFSWWKRMIYRWKNGWW